MNKYHGLGHDSEVGPPRTTKYHGLGHHSEVGPPRTAESSKYFLPILFERALNFDSLLKKLQREKEKY